MMNKRSGRGQYDTEYRLSSCFWGKRPAKFVRLITQHVKHSRGHLALDLGAGEGKNSFYLRSLGYEVTAVEISRFAVVNFLKRMIEEEIDDGITLILGDAREIPVRSLLSYDVIVAYGLLHCFENIAQVDNIIDRIQKYTSVGGINILSAFTDRLPIPNIQDYLSPILLPEDYILSLYKNWSVLEYENDTLVESHPTTNVEHKHSIFRLIARREA